MITFITDCRGDNEREILPGVAAKPLILKTLKGKPLVAIPSPAGGWSHNTLQSLSETLTSFTAEGADAYIGAEWVGSTEV